MHVSSAKPCRRLHLEVLRCAFHEETLNTLRKRRMKEKNERESNCLTVPSTDVSSLARPHLSPRFSSHRPKLFVPFFRPVSSDRALSPSLPLPPAAPRLFLFPPPPPPFHFIVLFLFSFFTPSRFQSIARCWDPERTRGSVRQKGEGARAQQRGFFESNPSLSTR